MKFELTEEQMNTLRTGSLIDRVRVFRDATGWNLKMAHDACKAIIEGRMKIEEFFTPKSPCPKCDGTGFVKAESGATPAPMTDELAEMRRAGQSVLDSRRIMKAELDAALHENEEWHDGHTYDQQVRDEFAREFFGGQEGKTWAAGLSLKKLLEMVRDKLSVRG